MMPRPPIVYMRTGSALSVGLQTQLKRSVVRQHGAGIEHDAERLVRLDVLMRTLPVAIDILSDTRCQWPLSTIQIDSTHVVLHVETSSFQPLTPTKTMLIGFHQATSNRVEVRLLEALPTEDLEPGTRLATAHFFFSPIKSTNFETDDPTSDGDLGIVIERIPSAPVRSGRSGKSEQRTVNKLEES